MKKVAIIILSISMPACGMSSLKKVSKTLLVRSFMRSCAHHHKDNAPSQYSPYYQWQPKVYENPSHCDPENKTDMLKQQECYKKISNLLRGHTKPIQALIKAIREDDVDAAKLLMPLIGNINDTDEYCQTALCCAVYKKNKKWVELLMSRSDLDLNFIDTYRKTALMYAFAAGDKEIIDLLIKKGAKL